MIARGAIAAIALVFVACSSDGPPGGGGSAADAASADVMAGPPDGGAPDSAIAADAGEDAALPPDAGTADAEAADSDVADAEVGDALVNADAEVSDAVITDAEASDSSAPDGQESDAGDSDASARDAADSDASPADAADSGAPPTTDAGNRCTSSLDCIAGAEVCGDIRVVMGTIETRCTHTNPAPPALPIGGACTADSQCATNLCLDTFANECTLICADATRDCPAGFACTGYRYNPGMVWVYECSRTCADNDDCGMASGGNPGNLCSPQVYERGASWFADPVCQLPAGPGALGTTCANGNDCASGLCLTTTRGTNCTGAADCMSDETCECPAGTAPPCAGGATASCISHLCSNVCDDDPDCSAPGQSLTTCRFDIELGLPDGTTVMLPSCGRN